MMSNRIEQLRDILATESWDALLISDQDNRYFASGYRAEDHSGRSAGVLLITPATAQLFTNGNNIDWAHAAAPDFETVKTLAALLPFNPGHGCQGMGYSGQEHLTTAQSPAPLHAAQYRHALALTLRHARAEGIDQVLQEHKLDALIAPTGGTAWLTDFINGDASGSSFTSPAAVAGYPHITVPAGMVRGLPVGLSFVGTAWTESALIAMAYAYEQASLQRKAPTYHKSVNMT